MQRRVLDNLYKQGGLSLFAFPGETPDYEALERFAQAQNAGARFVVFDFTGKKDGNVPFTVEVLFQRFLTEDELKYFDSENKVFVGGFAKPSESEADFRKFYHNLELIKKRITYVFGILPSDAPKAGNDYIFKIAKTVIIDSESLEAASVYIEDSPALQKATLVWLLPQKPIKKLYPRAYNVVSKSFSFCKEFRKTNWKENPEKFSKAFELLCKASILRKNPLDGIPKLFVRLFWIFLLAVIVAPFLIPTKMEMDVSNMRDRFAERLGLRRLLALLRRFAFLLRIIS